MPEAGAPAEGQAAPADVSESAHYAQALSAALAEGGPDDANPEPGEKAPEGDEPIEVSKELADPPAEGEEPTDVDPPKAAKPKEEAKKDDKPEPQKLREAIEAETREKLRGEFTALARDRKKLRERESAIAAKEQGSQAYVQKAQAFDQIVQRLAAGDHGVFRELYGERADEVTNKFLDGIVASEKSPAEREVARLRAEREQEKAQAKLAEQQRTIAEWQSSVRATVEAAGERFDLVNSLGQHAAVIQTIEDYYVKYPGAVLPVEDAAQAIEDLLAKGLERSKKFGARAPVTNAQPSKAGSPAPTARKEPKPTLSSVPVSELPAGADDLPLDPDKRFKAVMAGLG